MDTNDDFYNDDWNHIDGNWIHRTAIVYPWVKLGKGNTIGAFCVIGGNGEIRGVSQNDFNGIVEIGDNNVISEHVTIQRPLKDGASTKIGDGNIIMAHSHIGHDVVVGDGCEICTTCVIGGHAVIGSGTKIKLHSVIRNRAVIGMNVLIGMGSVVVMKNVPDNSIIFGNPAKPKKTA